MTNLEGASILVTGGAGFIGSHLVDALLSQGAREVRVVDNLVNGTTRNLSAAMPDERLRFAEVDIRDEAPMRSLLDGVDVVFHLACLGVRHSLHAPRENHDVNATATLELLEWAMSANIGRFVHVSSSEVYGTAQYAPMDEGHPTHPETVYGGAKLAGEAYARAAFRTHSFPTIVARPFNAYGPRSHFEGDSGEVLPRTIVRTLAGERPIVFGDGEQSRDFTHVTDTARGIIALAESDDAVGQTVNIGYGSDVTINDLCRVVLDTAGRTDLAPLHLDPRPGDVRQLLADSTRMRELTGYAPQVSFEQGAAELFHWFSALDVSPQEMLDRIEDRNWSTEAASRG